jgi:hypothetical protein
MAWTELMLNALVQELFDKQVVALQVCTYIWDRCDQHAASADRERDGRNDRQAAKSGPCNIAGI